jgi:hypothetical protein
MEIYPKIIGQFFSNCNVTSDHSFFPGEIEEASPELFPPEKKEYPCSVWNVLASKRSEGIKTF